MTENAAMELTLDEAKVVIAALASVRIAKIAETGGMTFREAGDVSVPLYHRLVAQVAEASR
jgi:hypothetical protein